jgi:hypothetical protein
MSAIADLGRRSQLKRTEKRLCWQKGDRWVSEAIADFVGRGSRRILLENAIAQFPLNPVLPLVQETQFLETNSHQ